MDIMIDERRERYINPYTDTGIGFNFLSPEELEKLPTKERKEYEERLKIYRDLKNSMDTSFNKGKEEGREEGREEGKAEAAIASARKMKSKGYPSVDIAEITGLTVEEIERL